MVKRNQITTAVTAPIYDKDHETFIHKYIDEELSHSCSKLQHNGEGKDKPRVLIVTKISSQQDDNDDDDDEDDDY